jgi:hypothetical protein
VAVSALTRTERLHGLAVHRVLCMLPLAGSFQREKAMFRKLAALGFRSEADLGRLVQELIGQRLKGKEWR